MRLSSVSTEDFVIEIRNWIENGVIRDSEKTTPLIPFVISRYRLLKSRKEKRGQVYLQKIMKSASWRICSRKACLVISYALILNS